MKKNFIALVIAASLMTGCASNGGEQVDYKKLQVSGQDLYTQSIEGSYQPSTIQDLEVVRTSVNAVFLIAKPTYEQYTSNLMKSTEIKTYFAAVEAAESEEDKRAVYDNLTPKTKASVDEFVNGEQSHEIMVNLGEAAKVALTSIAVFEKLDTSSIMKNIDFSDLMAEKNKLSLTGEQVAYLNDTVISAYNNYQVVAAFSKAQ